MGTASAEQDHDKLKQDITPSGNDVDDNAIRQPLALHRENADGVELEQPSGRAAFEVRTYEDQDGSTDNNDHVGIGRSTANEEIKPDESSYDQPKQHAESNLDDLDIGQPQTLYGGLHGDGGDELISGGGGQMEGRGESVESRYRSASFEDDGDTSVRIMMHQM